MRTTLALTYSTNVGYLTLLPPEGKPPTLDHEVMADFEQVLDELTLRAGSLVAVVLQSASPKFFCAGANLNVMGNIDETTIGTWVRRGHGLMNRLEQLPLPVIARVEGYAMGGGLELAMACDVIVASSRAQFAQSEGRLGLVTGWGGCFRLERRVGLSRAKELIFTGRTVGAEEAARLGIVEWQGEPEALDRHLQDLLSQISLTSRVAIKEMKQILSRCHGATLDENRELEVEASQRSLREGDGPARLDAFLRARKARGSSS